MAALTRWANAAPGEAEAAGRRGQRGLLNKFLNEVRERFPDLPEREVAVRADRLLRAHMIKLRGRRGD